MINLPVEIIRFGVSLTCLGISNLQMPPFLPAWGFTGQKRLPVNSPLATARLDLVMLAEPHELDNGCQALQVLEIDPASWIE